MAVKEADSGRESDNAGKKDGLDDAISAALSHHEAEGLSSYLKGDDDRKGAGDEESRSPQESAGDEASSEDATATEADDEGNDELSAPKHWPAADRQAFGKLPREAQEILLKKSKDLEGGYTRKSQELSDKARFYDQARGLIDDTTRRQLQTVGMDELGYFRYLHSLQQEATRNPVGYVKMAMQMLGVTPEHIGVAPDKTAPASTAASPDDEIARLLADPKVSELEARLQRLQAIIDQEQRLKQEAIQAHHVNAINSLNAQIQSFRESLDEHGQLKYPHFDTVRSHMGALMESDPDLAKLPDGPEKLQKAYDMAVWARPDLRQSLVEAEAQRKIREAQKKREAERAKKVAAVKPASGIVSTKPKTNSLDDALAEAMSRLGF